jgi:hypothetical protein
VRGVGGGQDGGALVADGGGVAVVDVDRVRLVVADLGVGPVLWGSWPGPGQGSGAARASRGPGSNVEVEHLKPTCAAS